jgi:transposase
MITLMPNTSLAIKLQPAEQTQLEKWGSSHGTPQQVALRYRIILGALAGQDNVSIAEQLGVSRPTVQLWRKRVHAQGIGGVWEIAPGRGRKPQYDQAARDGIIQATLRSKPKGMTHWSCRLMAESQEVSKNTVNRLWQLHNLKPHLSRTFKLSRDARFLEKLTDVVGLYLNPPDKTLVLCLDEKSQIQALDRTQPGLPLKKGRCGTMTHDYKRNGTTTLFAALNVLDGKVIGECHSRHRHQEWLKFLRRLDREFPQQVQLHLVMDNYGTHKEPHVKVWLKKHTRIVSHFDPTRSSRLNLVERRLTE